MKRIGVKPEQPPFTSVNLDSLEVRVDAVLPPTTEELLGALQELQYRTAVRVPRTFGELVGPDDEVNVEGIREHKVTRLDKLKIAAFGGIGALTSILLRDRKSVV
jgi:hypothetical protein